MRIHHGFNLLELIIVVLVIGILATIALPSYQQYAARAAIDRCYTFVTPARMTADFIIQNNGGAGVGVFGVNPVASLGLSGSNTCENITVDNIDAVNNGDIDISGVIRGNTMRWRRDGTNGVWNCTTVIGDSTLSPQTCP